MHPDNVGYDLPSFVEGFLQETIKDLRLIQGKAFGGAVTLSNDHCIFSIISNGPGVTFYLSSVADAANRFALADYLMVSVEGGYFRYFPRLPQGTDGLTLHQEAFKNFNNVLKSGVLFQPLSGDFTWTAKVLAMEEEDTRLSKELTRLRVIEKHPECDSIRRKKSNGDLTWMDDVRRILAEQESKS